MKRTRQQACLDQQYDLHSDGFTVHRAVIQSTDGLLNTFIKKTNSAKPIFNNSGKNDNKRTQFKIRQRDMGLVKPFEEYLTKHYSNHKLTEWNIIHSKKCNRQQAHTDYEPSSDILKCSNEDIPLSALFPISTGAKIVVWPGSINMITCDEKDLPKRRKIQPKIININPGDILVFRADLVHAGAEYDSDNIRGHVFMDTDKVHRPKNRTYIIKRHSNDTLKSIIVE